MYQALYRRWRLHTFDDVVGQSHITDTLKHQVATSRLNYAYLFTDTRGAGKTIYAKILARAVDCEHPVDSNPCNRCPPYLGIESGSILDVLEPDAASNSGVGQVRTLRDEAVYTPAAVRKRMYIMNEVHILSTTAFSALLRILEEPSEHLILVLATTKLHKVPATIRSRCQQFSFKRVLPGDTAAWLAYVAWKEGIKLREEGASLLVKLVDDGLQDALSPLSQCAGPSGPIGEQEVLDALELADNLETTRLMEQFGRGDAIGALETLAQLYGAGKDVGSLPGELSTLTRNLLIRKTAPQGDAALLTGGYDESTVRRPSSQFQTAWPVQMLGLLRTAIADLSRSGDRRTDTELCLIRLYDPGLDESTATLDARLARVKELLAGGIPTAYAIPGQPMKQSTLAKREPSAPRAGPVPTERPPSEEERPPLSDEPGERVDIDKTPEPSAAPGDRLVAGEAPAGGEADRGVTTDLWPDLMAAVRGEFPTVYPFLNDPTMVQGRPEDEALTPWVEDESTKGVVGGTSILEEPERLASAQTDVPARCAVRVGKAPTAPAAAALAQAAERDRLGDLLTFDRRFDSIITQE